jgi:DNA-binding CsgD family transcriptional regulator
MHCRANEERVVTSDLMRRATIRLSQIGFSATDHLDAQQQLIRLVRSVIPFDAGSIATVDPATVLWTSCVLEGMEANPQMERFLFQNEFASDDLNKIVFLARDSSRAGRLSEHGTETLERSPRYQILAGQGAVDELRCALVENGHCWGSFEIYRGSDSGVFTAQDIDVAQQLSKPIAEALRMALLSHAARVPQRISESPAVLIVHGDGGIESISSGGDALLEDLGSTGDLPPAVRALLLRVQSASGSTQSVTIPRNSGGWARVHAMTLGDSGDRFSVIIEPARTPELPATIAHAFGFTEREQEIIMHLARGLSSKEIAQQLGISAHTVNDHIKSSFAKAGVQSRQQLVARLFFDHCLPLREREAIPGPYGWFLEPENPKAIRTA